MDDGWIDDLSAGRRRIFLIAIGVEGGMGVVAVAVGFLLGMPVGQWVTWSQVGLLWGMAGAAVMLALLWLCRVMPVDGMQRLNRLADRLVRSLFGRSGWWELLVIALLAGWGEEFLFRGLLQGGLESLFGGLALPFPGWMPQAAALVIASVGFGFAHCLSREYVVFATFIGLMLGGMAIATGDLLAPIVAHAAYDFVALLLLRGNAANRASVRRR